MIENSFYSLINPLLNSVKKLENSSKKMSIDSVNLIKQEATIVLSKSPEFFEIERKVSENEKRNSNKIAEEMSSRDSSENINVTNCRRHKRSYVKKNNERVKRWTKQETALYQNFVEIYKDIMRDSSSKRNSKIFLQMSKFIGSKTPSQCRSHHQKFYRVDVKDKDSIQKKKKDAKFIKKENIENGNTRIFSFFLIKIFLKNSFGNFTE